MTTDTPMKFRNALAPQANVMIDDAGRADDDDV